MLADLDQRFHDAVQAFWDARDRQKQKQVDSGKIDAGNRGAVTGGTQMGALEVLLTDVLVNAGLRQSDIRVRTALELPGYYRPEKKWDLLVVSGGQLVMAVEFKSMVGSFGNNTNNRSEEAVGNAEDIWTAFREGRFGQHQAPMLGFFFLLEDCTKVHKPVRVTEPYFKVDPVFKAPSDAKKNGPSYAMRYQVLCERLVLERKYTATCLTLATKASPTEVRFPAATLNFRQFAAAADAHARVFINSRLCFGHRGLCCRSAQVLCCCRLRPAEHALDRQLAAPGTATGPAAVAAQVSARREERRGVGLADAAPLAVLGLADPVGRGHRRRPRR